MTNKKITKIKPYRFNTTKTDVDLNDIQILIFYLTEIELRLDNQDSLVKLNGSHPDVFNLLKPNDIYIYVVPQR